MLAAIQRGWLSLRFQLRCAAIYNKRGAVRGSVCACYDGLPAGLDSRLPASCRGSSGEADHAKPENLDSGPQVPFNLLWIVFG